MENTIWEFSNSIVAPPTDPKELAIRKLKDVKSRRIILYRVNDYLIPHLFGKTTVRDMWEAPKGLFKSKNENRKMVLREKLRDMKMARSNTMTTYLTWIRQVRDELVGIGETMDDSVLVRMTLKGFMKEWTSFIKGVVAREKLPDWSRLWDDFV
jgi:hypothetical protein